MTDNSKQTTAVANKPYDVVAAVAKTLRRFNDQRELVLPEDYAIENALKAAYLILQETEDKNHIPVLQACSKTSIANSLLDMAVQGLNPGKDQCYFIAYGKKLSCQRSYFGTMAVAKRVAGATDIWAEVVYKGDEFEYEITHNRKNITKHTQRIENVGASIIAAYCVIEFNNGKPDYTEIMTIEQIHRAWDKSKMKTDDPASTHSKFPEEMAKRTVINRACKKYINASSDSNLFLDHFNRSDEERTEEEVAEDIEENANQEVIDIDVVPEGKAPETEEKEDVVPEKQETEEKTTLTEGEGEKQKALTGPGF